MRNLKPRRRDAPAAVEEKVEIKGARRVSRSTRFSSGGGLQFSQKGEKGFRRESGLPHEGGIEEVRLRGTSDGRGPIEM
jgi:hypothetical protein